MALDFFAGCLGGCAGIIVGYPLDTIKVHMQTQDYRNPKYKGNWHCFRSILAKESVAGLYRGMSSPVAGVAVVNAIIFGVYGETQRRIPDPDSLRSHFVAGAVAGIAQSPICSPMELAKTRMQLQTPASRFSGPIQCLKHAYEQEGYRGVFRGLSITFLREAPSFGVYFVTYEALTRTSGSEHPVSTPCMLLAGGLAGTASWLISYPLDVIKSRIQAIDGNRYAGMIDCLKQSVKAEGYSCLYKGLSSTILRAFPVNAVTFATVTWTFRMFQRGVDGTTITDTKSTVIESVKKVTEVSEPFLEKWSNFCANVSESIITPRLCYLSLPLTPTSDLRLCDSTLCQANNRGKEGIKCDVTEVARGNKQCKEENEKSKGGKEDVDEGGGEKKVTGTVIKRMVNTVSVVLSLCYEF